MPIVVFLALLPTVAFYFYVLVQFWKEANRRRHHDTCAMIVPLHPVRTSEIGSDKATWPGFPSVSGRERTARPERARVLEMCLNNRRAARVSEPACSAAKQAAKG
jgi:hypothetical protein